MMDGSEQAAYRARHARRAGGKRLDVGELSGLTVEDPVTGGWIVAPASA
jgi:hypothetical protein